MRFEIRDILALLVVLLFGAALVALFFVGVPGENKEQVIFMLGQAAGLAALVLGSYFSAGKDDGQKTENTAKAFDAIKAMATQPAGVTVEPPATVTTTIEPGT